MPRKFLKRYLPNPESLRQRRGVRIFGALLNDPFLLHLNRRSVAGGLGVGLFCAFVPLPMQMLLAAAVAILLRVNLVIAVSSVWITNPLTIPPMFWFCYRVGTWLLGAPPPGADFQPSLEWFWHELGVIWQPLFLGSFLVGTVAALAGYGGAHLLWRLHVLRALQRRRQRRHDAGGSSGRRP